jgi:beta-lactamase superfamily II metal-dependent hydrolase
MAELSITFLDVGWGDSILLEAVDDAGYRHFGLVDSNDTTNWPTSRVYLKRHFERYDATAALPRPYPFFSVVLASHAHADHVSGLQAVLRQYGTDRLLFPRFDSASSPTLSNLLRWARRATRNNIPVARSHQYLDSSCSFRLGPVDVQILWPPAPPTPSDNYPHDPRNENNNSLVLRLELGDVRMVLTGDCQAENWSKPPNSTTWPIPLPPDGLKLVQVPHHGARNGLFDSSGNVPLFDQIRQLAQLDPSVAPLIAVSCHAVPHGHPHPDVESQLAALSNPGSFPTCVSGTHWLRTDRSLHFTVWTDGIRVETRARPPS